MAAGRSAERPAQRGVSDGLVLGVLVALVGGSASVWAAACLGGLLEHGAVPNIGYTDSVTAARHLLSNPHDIPAAWPGAPAGTLPSAPVFYALLILLLFLLAGAVLWVLTWRMRRSARRRGATRRRTSATGPDPAAAEGYAPFTEQPTPAEYQAYPAADFAPDYSTAEYSAAEYSSAGAPAARRSPGPGDLADAAAIRAALSAQAVLGRAGRIRPDAAGTLRDPRAVALPLGRDVRGGTELYGGLDESYLVVGPPRSGKSAHLVIPAVRAAPGPAVVVTQSVDVFRETANQRARLGPLLVFDPLDVAEGAIAGGVGTAGSADAGSPGGWAPAPVGVGSGRRPRVLRWGPQYGCEDPSVANARARSLVAGTMGHGSSWGAGSLAQPVTVLRCYLQAAAIDGAAMDRVQYWAANPDDPEPVRVLAAASWAADGWATDLDAAIKAEPGRRDGVWRVVRAALAPLAEQRTLRACSPSRRDPFDMGALIRESGTLYVLAPADGSVPLAPLAAAFVDEVVGRCRTEARRAPAGRLAPPLLFVLDDAAATAPLAGLPELMASTSGLGITPMATLRSLEDAVGVWGASAAAQLWQSSSVRVVLGAAAALEDGAGIAGDAPERVRDAVAAARTSHRTGAPVGADLPPGTGAVLHPRIAPVVTRFTPYWSSPGRSRPRLRGR